MNIDVDLSRITTLIIDDSRYARSFIKTALQSFGIKTILEAGDGPTGLEILGQQPVHLVIVDHDMAPMDGIDFTRFVRAGDMVAVKAFFELPKCDRLFLRKLMQTVGGTETERRRVAPGLVHFYNNLPL